MYSENFLKACEVGDFDRLKRLKESYDLFTPEEVCAARSDVNEAFRRACRRGRLEVATWLSATFGVTSGEAYAACGGCSKAIRMACYDGHLEVAKWLHAAALSGGSTPDEAFAARSEVNEAFRHACRRGHLEVAEWLHATFRVNPTVAYAARGRGDPAFRIACYNGRLEVAEWLHATFGMMLSDDEASYVYYESLRWACRNGHLEVAEWLNATFALPTTPSLPPLLASHSSGQQSTVGYDNEVSCAVCRFRRRNLLCKPCGHSTMCLECAHEWYRGRRMLACVYCTQSVESFEVIDDA